MQRDMEADVKWEQRPVVQASLDDLNMGLVTRFTGAARDTDLTVDLDEPRPSSRRCAMRAS